MSVSWQTQKSLISDLLIDKGYKEIPDNINTPFSTDYLFVVKPMMSLNDAIMDVVAQLTIFYAVKDTATFDEKFDEFLLLVGEFKSLGFFLSANPTIKINEEENTLAQAEMLLVVGQMSC